MRKTLTLMIAAFFAFAASAGAENYTAKVVDRQGTVELQTIFFDYEEGVWHGAPVDKSSDLKAWKDIDLKKQAIFLEDGRELGVLDNRPAFRKNGKFVALK